MTTARQGRTPRGLLAALFAAFVAFAGVFVLPPLDRDESRFAQATAQMLETGDFVNIRFQELERNKKPAGVYWLQAAAVSAVSSVEARAIFAYRLPSALALVLASFLLYLAGRRLFDPQTGLLAALLFAATPLAAAEATIAKTDSVLMLTVVLAQTALIHIVAKTREGGRAGWAWPLAFWASIAAGVLVKGPIAPMIALLTVAGMSFDAEARRRVLPALRPATGALLALAMISPWLVAIDRATEGRFFAEAIGRDMLGKIGAAQESHAAPPGFHLLLAPLLLWPAIALLPGGLIAAWRSRRADWRFALLLAWAVPGWIFFELISTKLPHYVLPLYPALALVAARAATGGFAGAKAGKIGAVLYGVAGVTLGAAVGWLPSAYGAPGVHVAPIAVGALVAVAALVLAAAFWNGKAATAAPRAAVLSALFAAAVFIGVAPRLERLDVSRNLSDAFHASGRHPLRDGAPAAALAGYAEPSAIFLLGTRTIIGDGAEAAHHLATTPGAAVAVEAREEESFRWGAERLGVAPRPLGVVMGVNYSKGDEVRLTLYAATPRRAAP